MLALCHSVVPEHVEETGEIKLSASSPDDEALVCGAKFFGFEFVDRTQGLAIIRLSNGELKRYQIIEMIEFNSTRKRMSVVVEVEGTIQLFCKGADTVMVDRLAWSEESLLKTTSEHMTSYAKEGLRTLMICRKTLDPEWFKQWHSDFKAASADLVQIEAKMLGKDNEIDKLSDKLEQGLKLVGASAIEDKLQDGVPEAIADMAKAGIKIWVLTGDKVETAINIAVACRLLQPEEYMEQIVIDGDTYKKKEKLKDKLIEAIKEYEDDVKEAGGNPNAVKPRALIIDGPALIKAMESDVKQYVREHAAQPRHSKRASQMVALCRSCFVAGTRHQRGSNRVILSSDLINELNLFSLCTHSRLVPLNQPSLAAHLPTLAGTCCTSRSAATPWSGAECRPTRNDRWSPW